MGSKGGKLPVGKPEQGGLHGCQCCLTPMGGGTAPSREGKYIYHKENENTTESIQISCLDDFLSLQRKQKMRFKYQFIYRLTGEPTLYPFSSSMDENH